MRYPMRLITIGVVVLAASFMVPSTTASPEDFPNAIHYDLPNAAGCKDGAYSGAKAEIETADPQIRDVIGFSIVRVFAQHETADHNWFAEVGWWKGFETGYVLRGVAIWNGPGGHDYEFYEELDIGSEHTYRVRRRPSATSTKWAFIIDGVKKIVRDVGFTSTTRVCSGGETSSILNAMGVSGCLRNKHRTLEMKWRLYGSHYHHVWPPGIPYEVRDINANNWQVLGNN